MLTRLVSVVLVATGCLMPTGPDEPIDCDTKADSVVMTEAGWWRTTLWRENTLGVCERFQCLVDVGMSTPGAARSWCEGQL